MPAAERQAVASRLEGVKPVIQKNLKGAQWANLNADLKRKIADAMEPAPMPAADAVPGGARSWSLRGLPSSRSRRARGAQARRPLTWLLSKRGWLASGPVCAARPPTQSAQRVR